MVQSSTGQIKKFRMNQKEFYGVLFVSKNPKQCSGINLLPLTYSFINVKLQTSNLGVYNHNQITCRHKLWEAHTVKNVFNQ